MAPIEANHFINNEFVASSDGKTFDLHSPYDGECVGKISEATTADVDAAVAAAKAAFPAWSALSPQQRGKPLKKLSELITAATSKLAHLDALSIGRPVDSFFDAYYAATQFAYFSEAAYPTGTSSLNTPGFINMSLLQPFGVVAAIIPWNSPLVFFSKKGAPAVAAGNCIVIKTSEKAPLTSHAVAEMIIEAGFPPGVINVVHGHGPVSGAHISSHMEIRAISFTGSVRTGRVIAKAAADSNFKHLVFELGGKTPAVVFDDADLDAAAQATQHSIMFHSGQTCMANARVYVQKGAAEKFIAKFSELASARKLGNPTQKGTMSGPQADKSQKETVAKYIEEGKKTGKMLGEEKEGGEKLGENFVRPTIFLDQPEDSKVMCEEIFGPVCCINTFEDEEDVLKKANDTEFGLYAAVFTKDLDRALRFAKGFESGMVGVNCTSPTGAWDMPFGGYKQSGVGREGFHDSLEDWLEKKAVFIKVGGLSTGVVGNSTIGR